MRRPPCLVALGVLIAGCLWSIPTADTWSRGPLRIAGADRYETAVRISSAMFDSDSAGADAVVLASGESFPDGLAAGPLAALKEGPVLLTAKDALPDVTATELERLEPTAIYVVGGSAAVSDEVLAAVEDLTTVTPLRIAGATRYETATAVASLFPASSPGAFVASGVDFPDALAGGGAAAMAIAPLLLTPPDALPTPVGDELARLAAPVTFVLGGTSAVSEDVLAAVDARVAGVRRLAGDDRYGTAAAIANDRAPDTTQVLVATGSTFPDALAAAPLARHFGAPVVLTAGCLPPDTLDAIRARDWADVTVVGGTSAVPELGLSEPCTPVPDGVLADGLTLDTHVLGGPNVARIVGITRRAGWDVRTTTASGNLLGRLATTDIARRLDSRVAVNGTFFNLANGDPSYTLAVDGRLLKAPGGGGTIIGLDPTNPDATFYATPDLTIMLDDFPIDRVNSGAPGNGETGMFTREYNDTVDVGSSYCRAALDTVGGVTLDAHGNASQDYEVADVDCSDDPIPDGDADIVAALEGTPEGDFVAALEGQVTYKWRVHPAANGVTIVMGGNLRLVIGGQVSTDVTDNTGDFFTEHAPRTAVCTLADATMLLVIVDGRQPGYSIGMTPRELADYLVSLGCIDALNLDGGGSTALVIDGVLANRPSDAAGQRPVGSALFLAPA